MRPQTKSEQYIRSVVGGIKERPPEPKPDKEGFKSKVKQHLKDRKLNMPENW